MTKTATPDDRVPVSEAAPPLGVSVWTLRRMIHRGQVRGYRPAGGPRGHLFVDRQDLERLLNEAEVRPASA